ncbi:MAG: GNAT family N-acetyltransferase [Mangrovicoccus sp.]
MNMHRSSLGSVTVSIETPITVSNQALIADSQEALLEILPENEIFSLDAEELTAPNCVFFVAFHYGKPMGCVALVDQLHYGEIKRLFVRPQARGLGLAKALMAALEDQCRDLGLVTLRLETGTQLTEAVQLYRAQGFAECEAFGDYPVLDSSLFMEKSLA